MTSRIAFFIFLAAILLLALEVVLYFSTGMAQALTSTGLSMAAAYKFLWLMVLTGAAGILAPVAAIVTAATQRKSLGLASWVVLIGLVMIGYTTISFLKAPSPAPSRPELAEPALPPSPSPEPPTLPAPAAKKITEVVELADSRIDQLDPEKIRVTLQFRNKSTRRITELDYAFTFVDDTDRVLMSIDLREGLFIPPGLTGESTLDWGKSGFKDPAQFDQLAEALSRGVLKVSVTLQRAKLDDGTIAEG